MTDVTTAPGDDLEITELAEFDPTRLDGVKNAATGIPFLIMKSVQDDEPDTSDTSDDDDAEKAVVNGKIDQKPDISLGEKICGLLGQAMGNESQEVAAGHHGESDDVNMLSQAHSIVRQWMAGEKTHPDGMKAAADAGCGCCADCTMDTAKAEPDDEAEKAKLTAASRDNLSDSDFAIPETRSYPIHDESHARNALSRVAENGTPAEKARVRAAVHRKYPGIGADDDKSSSKSVVAEGETTVDDVTQTEDSPIAKAVEEAVAKAVQPYEERITSLGADLAKAQAKADAAEATVKAWASKPIPGGPVLSANARPQGETKAVEDAARKARYYEDMANTVASPTDADGYRQLAAREKAKLAPA